MQLHKQHGGYEREAEKLNKKVHFLKLRQLTSMESKRESPALIKVHSKVQKGFDRQCQMYRK